ncbi:MAG TPA: glycosyltransferase [Gemmatimonadales bacterium]|nr:glycosyltransferase [Gemmatimonadales bacterium]
MGLSGMPSVRAAVVPGLVSVITPCYNAAPFVGETLAAVRAQTYAPVEHIVVDDGSRDESWAVIAAAGRASPLCAVRLAQNGGASHARNVGATLARGEYLMFLDADDLLAPDTLAALVVAVQDSADAIAVCEWRRLEAAHGKWVCTSPDVPLPARDADFLRGWIDETGWVPPCGVLWRREHYGRIGGWDESLTLNQDGDLMMRALASGARLVQAKGGTAYYRRHGDSEGSLSSLRCTQGKLRSRARVYEKLALGLERQGRLADYADSLGLAYHRIAHDAYICGHAMLGRDYQRRGERLVGPRTISGTAAGRLLALVLGMDTKERLVQWLARHGVSTRARRRTLERAQRLAPAAVDSPEPGTELRPRSRAH